MFRNNIAFRGICTIILFITMGISHASVPITLEIEEPANPEINICSDPGFATQGACEAGTPIWTDAGATWNGATCSDPSFPIEETCVNAGTCSSPNFLTEKDCVGGCSTDACSEPIYKGEASCTNAGFIWTAAGTDVASCTNANGIWTPAGTPFWTAFTLDIVMTNTAGCSSCSDPLHNNKEDCEDGEGVWTFDTSMNDPATCAGVCSNGTTELPITSEAACTDHAAGTCSDDTSTTKAACEAAEETWTLNTWEASAINGNYFSGEVAAFQFRILGSADGGIDAAGVSGGTAEDILTNLQLDPETGIVLAFSLTGDVIPAGEDVLLTTMRFSTTGDVSCFAPQDCSGGSCDNEVSDSYGFSVDTDWGDCYCVTDTDTDGFCDSVDNCPVVVNSDQLNTDDDGYGDACDTYLYDANDDADGDGIADCTLIITSNCPQTYDNCPDTQNANQTDTDSDGLGDACDACPNDSANDADGDGVCGDVDNCPAISNESQTNSDGDTHGDACDNCSNVTNENQLNSDDDGYGDACDNCAALDNENQADGDTDGIGDVCDNCSAVSNAGQLDADFDAVGDDCDLCDGTEIAATVDSDGCSEDQCAADTDLDGVCDNDNCPDTQNANQADADSDGLGDACDACPNDSANDADGDGVCGDVDNCADTVTGATVDADGCSADQLSISKIGGAIPNTFAIAQNFPNPFNPVTSITFDVAEVDEVSLVVYTLSGKEVATLVSGIYTPGTYNVQWNAVNNAGDGIVSGMYIYRYISSEKVITRKMLYLK